MSATDGVGYFCVVHEREATKPVTISGDALAATANFTTRTRTPPIYPTSKAIFLPFLQPSKIRFNDPPIIFRSGIRFARRIEQLPCPPSSSPPRNRYSSRPAAGISSKTGNPCLFSFTSPVQTILKTEPCLKIIEIIEEERKEGRRRCVKEEGKKKLQRRIERKKTNRPTNGNIYISYESRREREREKHIHSRNLCARLLSINLIVTRFEPSSSVSALPRCACARMRARVCLAFIVYCALASCTHDFDPPPRTFKKPVRLDPHITPVKS